MNIHLKAANHQDLEKISELAKVIWVKHYPSIIGELQVKYMLDNFYSLSALKVQMDQGQNFYLIQSEIAEDLGYLSVSQNSEEVFIHKFYLSNPYQNLGLGSKTLKLLTTQYPSATTFRLQVNRQNYTAINFYFKNGFTIEKVADFDIGNGFFMNDFLMVKKLPLLIKK